MNSVCQLTDSFLEASNTGPALVNLPEPAVSGGAAVLGELAKL